MLSEDFAVEGLCVFGTGGRGEKCKLYYKVCGSALFQGAERKIYFMADTIFVMVAMVKISAN